MKTKPNDVQANADLNVHFFENGDEVCQNCDMANYEDEAPEALPDSCGCSYLQQCPKAERFFDAYWAEHSSIEELMDELLEGERDRELKKLRKAYSKMGNEVMLEDLDQLEATINLYNRLKDTPRGTDGRLSSLRETLRDLVFVFRTLILKEAE